MITQTCAELQGTPKQIKYADVIREQTLHGDCWSDEHLDLLRKVADSTWWIANRHDLAAMTYKIPQPYQLAGGPPRPGKANIAGQNAHARQMDLTQEATEMSDAHAFAASVAKKPKLAEITVLALLARLYKPNSQQRTVLRARAHELLLREGKHERDEKDLDAITRILRPLT